MAWRGHNSDLHSNTDSVLSLVYRLQTLDTQHSAHERGTWHLCAPAGATAPSPQATAPDSLTTTSPTCKEEMSGHWSPESHRTLSQCFWNIVFLFLLVTHKKKRKSQKGFFFWSPTRKSLGELINLMLWDNFLLGFRQILTNWWYQTRLGKLNIAAPSVCHSDFTWTNWAFTKGFKGSNMSLRGHSLSPIWDLKENL